MPNLQPLQIISSGLFGAAIFFLVAAGLQLIFGVQKIVNLATGSFYALGAYFGLSAANWAIANGLPTPLFPLALVGGGLLFAAVLGGNVAVQAQTTQGQFELERLQATARQRRAAYQQLRLRVAELEAPQRIVGRARQLGMVEPAAVTYLSPTAATSAAGPPTAPEPDRASPSEAAQGWADVKAHLDGGR